MTITTVTTPKPTPTITGPTTMYVEKGWYPEEDEARKWLAAMFKRDWHRAKSNIPNSGGSFKEGGGWSNR